MNSHRSAIARKTPSAPMQALAQEGRLEGMKLDYGCGRGFDADHYDMHGFDPHFRPSEPGDLYDTITCNYVLNVVKDRETRLAILSDIQRRLAPEGQAYITVRADRKSLNGPTSIGTWQGDVREDLAPFFPLLRSTASYATYVMTKNDKFV